MDHDLVFIFTNILFCTLILLGRFRVDDVVQDHREDCYIATLHINQADVQDSRPYYLVVENDRGADRHSIILKVEGLFPGKLCRRFELGKELFGVK
jgi:hypothetical protein